MHFFNLSDVFLVDGLTDAGRLADWLTCCSKGGRGSGLPRRISALHWLARRLRTNYFKMHFKLSGQGKVPLNKFRSLFWNGLLRSKQVNVLS